MDMNFKIEGVMITSLYDKTFNYKYKVGKYDERRFYEIFKSQEDGTPFPISEEDASLIKLIEDMYKKRIYERRKKPKKDKSGMKAVEDRYSVYVSNQFSKINLNIKKIGKNQEFRNQAISEIVDSVIEDIMLNNDGFIDLKGQFHNDHKAIINKLVSKKLSNLIGNELKKNKKGR